MTDVAPVGSRAVVLTGADTSVAPAFSVVPLYRDRQDKLIQEHRLKIADRVISSGALEGFLADLRISGREAFSDSWPAEEDLEP